MVNETDEKRYPFLMTGQKIYIIKTAEAIFS